MLGMRTKRPRSKRLKTSVEMRPSATPPAASRRRCEGIVSALLKSPIRLPGGRVYNETHVKSRSSVAYRIIVRSTGRRSCRFMCRPA